MEWIEGVKLTDTAAMERHGLRIVDFVDIGIECSLRQLLAEDGGFFHADPHPGLPPLRIPVRVILPTFRSRVQTEVSSSKSKVAAAQ